MTDATDLIVSSPLGTRMTVRRRIDDGYTDALGYLREVTATECAVETRRGLITIPLAEVTAAKLAPPPPVRRTPQHPPAD